MQAHEQDFDIGEAITAGWNRFWPNIGPMALFAVIVWGLNLLLQVPQAAEAGLGTRFVFNVIGFVVGQLVAIGWITIALAITDGRPVSRQEVFDRFGLIVPYLLAALLYALMVTVGLILLVVPGVVLAIIFVFYGFHIVDTGERDPIGALRRSAELTRGNRWKLLGLGLVLIAVNLLGVLALLIGVLFTSGISLLAIAHVYRRLAPAAGPETAPGTAPA